MAYWFRNKYNLTPKDPRFLCMTPEEIETEYWAAHYYDKPATETVIDEDFDINEVEALMENEDWENIIDVKQDRD